MRGAMGDLDIIYILQSAKRALALVHLVKQINEVLTPFRLNLIIYAI